MLCRTEGKANPLLAAPALAEAAVALGAQVSAYTDVLGIERHRGGFRVDTTSGPLRCDRVVACAGSDTGRILALVGTRVPVEGLPMQVSATEPVPPLISHLVQFAGGLLTIKQASAGTVLIGGGWPGGLDERSSRAVVDLRSLSGNLELALDVVPSLAGATLLRTWAGLCPYVPDELPVIGEVRGSPGLVVSLFPYLGFTCGPIMGKLAATIALGEDAGRDLTAFSPARFN
jgi:glycine/D-amino acid oxidase-like deaminating enzyme